MVTFCRKATPLEVALALAKAGAGSFGGASPTQLVDLVRKCRARAQRKLCAIAAPFKNAREPTYQSINQFNLKSVWDLAQIHQTM